MRKRFVFLFLILSIVLNLLISFPVAASTEIIADGICGDNLRWSLDGNGTLTISGKGEMYNYNSSSDPPWYSLSSQIKALSIEEGVTSIATVGFCYLRIHELIIPNTVISVGTGAFASDSIETLSLGNCVEMIGDYAFQNCRYLKNVSIPISCKKIGYYAFMDCDNLQTVIIPNGVESIDYSAFANCDSLKEVNIPASIKMLGSPSPFNSCKSITKVNVDKENQHYTSVDDSLYNKDKTQLLQIAIGKEDSTYTILDTVKKIFPYAFAFSEKLQCIAVGKNVEEIGWYSFYNCEQLNDVYYRGTELEWKNISIGTYGNEYLKNAIIHYNYIYPIQKSSNSTSNAPIIKSAKITQNSKTYDIVTQAVSINKNSSIRYDIKLDIDWKGVVPLNQDVYLTQGVSNQNNDVFVQYNSLNAMLENVQIGTVFEPDKPIYIIALDKSDPKNKSTSVVTKLNIVDNSNNDVFKNEKHGKYDFKIGKDISFKVPDDVPLFGGMDLSWQIDYIPLTFAYESEDKMAVTIGIKDLVTEDKDGLIKFKDFSFKEYKSAIKDYKDGIGEAYKKGNRSLKQLRNDARMKKANQLKEPLDMSIWGGKYVKSVGSGDFDWGVDCVGYAEINKKDGKWDFDHADGYLELEITVSYTYEGQVFIWVIPCYYEIGGEIGGGLKAVINSLDAKTYKPNVCQPDGSSLADGDPKGVYLTAKVGATIGAGIGVPHVATLGAKGEGSVNFQIGLGDVSEYQRVTVKANEEFTVEVLGQVVASKPFWELDPNKGVIYSTFPQDKDKSWIKPKSAKLMSLNSVYDGYDANKVYENESRDYLDKASTWVGNRQKVMLMSAGYSNKNLNRLANNVYPNSEPQICDINGTKVLVFTTDNVERTATNKQMLVYSVYNESNNTWSEPQPVCDDSTADFYPSISDEYIVWQNQKAVMGDNLSLADIGKQGEIVIAKWNGNGFDTPVSLTDNNELDTLPKIAVNGDNIVVSWVKNTDNDILGISGTSSIVKKTYNGSAWSGETVVKQNLNSVIDLSIGYSDDKLYIAYIPDGDGDISTIDDREIYLISDTETKVTDNEILDSHPIIDNGKIYWYSESNIYYCDLDGVETQTVFEDGRYQLAEGFSVSENNGNIAILWSGVKDEANEIMGVLCQNGEWEDVIEVSDLGGKAKYPTSVLDENGRMLTAFTSEIDDSTNLYTIDLIPSYDIAIDDVYFNESGLSPNSTNEIEVTVKNAGELPIESYNISVFNEDGTLNKSTEIIEAIKAGETKTVTAYFETGDEISLETLTVKAEIENDEYDISNNETTFEIGHADVELSNIENYELLPTSTVTATIENIGFSDAENITVSLRNATEDGEIIDSRTITSLAKGESQKISFEYEPKNYDDTQWYITIETETEEISKGNNSDYFINECALNLADFEHSVLNCQYSENTFSVNSFAINNTEKELNGTVFVAIYDKSSRLKKLSNQSFTLSAYSDTGVDTWVENYEKADGDIIKVFVWDGLSTIRPLTEAEVISQSKWIIE